MKTPLLLATLLAALSLAACDKPTVVNVPPPAAAPEPVPGPAGPQGATGNTGNTGNTGSEGQPGATGKAGDGTTVIVMPPAASAPTN
jgi:hypothetical protein